MWWVVCCPTIDVIAEDRMTDKLVSIMKQDCHPLHETVKACVSTFSSRLIQPDVIRNDIKSNLYQHPLGYIINVILDD